MILHDELVGSNVSTLPRVMLYHSMFDMASFIWICIHLLMMNFVTIHMYSSPQIQHGIQLTQTGSFHVTSTVISSSLMTSSYKISETLVIPVLTLLVTSPYIFLIISRTGHMLLKNCFMIIINIPKCIQSPIWIAVSI